MFGMDDAGANFMTLHQSIAGMAGGGHIRLLDQNGNYTKGAANGSGIVSVMAARALNNRLTSSMFAQTGARQSFITGGLSRGLLTGLQAQYIREQGGLTEGSIIVGKDFKAGIKGAEEGIAKMIDQGANIEDPAMQQLAQSVAVAKAYTQESNKKQYDPLRKVIDDLTKEVRKLETWKRTGKDDTGKAVDVEALENDLAVARVETEAARSQLHAEVSKNLKGKTLKKTDVAGIEVAQTTMTQDMLDTVQDVYNGSLSGQAISKKFIKDWEDSVSHVKDNITELSKIFNTEDFNILQGLATELNMNSLSNKNNAAAVARRIRNAKTEAERTGREVVEVFKEQAAILEVIKGTSGYSASAATVERMQAMRAAGERAEVAGWTNLSAEQRDAHMMAANNIIIADHGETINAYKLINDQLKSSDPEAVRRAKELDRLRKEYEAAKTPEEKIAAERRLISAARAEYGTDFTIDEVIREQALKNGDADPIFKSEAELVMQQQDADSYVRDIRRSAAKEARYKEHYGDDYYEKVKTQLGNVAVTVGADQETFGRLKDLGAESLAARNKILDSPKISKEDAEKIRTLEKENAKLDDQLYFETDPNKRDELIRQKDKNNKVIKSISREYAEEKEKYDKKVQTVLTRITEDLHAGDYTEEQISKMVKDYSVIVNKSSSMTYTDQESIVGWQRFIETSKAPWLTQGKLAEAKQRAARHDNFLNSIETKGQESTRKDFLRDFISNIITGGVDVTEHAAMTHWLSNTKNSGLAYAEDGSVVVDVEKINNNNDENVIAIKRTRTTEENEQLAKNKKVQNFLGVTSEEEALSILTDQKRLIKVLQEKQDSGDMGLMQVGEGDKGTIVGMSNAVIQNSGQELIAIKNENHAQGKYWNGAKGVNFQLDKEKNITGVTIGNKTYTEQKDIDNKIVELASQNKEMRTNLRRLAGDGDEKAKQYMEQISNLDEMAMYTNSASAKVGDLMQSMSNEDGKFDKKWSELTDKEKEKYGSESAYNLARAVMESKYSAVRTLTENKEGRKKLSAAAKEVGIDFNGSSEDLQNLEARQMEVIASKVSETDKEFSKQYNRYDFLKEGNSLLNSGKVKADGMVELDGPGGDSENKIKFNVFDPTVMRALATQAELSGGDTFDEAKLQTMYMASTARSLNVLLGCIVGDTLQTVQKNS